MRPEWEREKEREREEGEGEGEGEDESEGWFGGVIEEKIGTPISMSTPSFFLVYNPKIPPSSKSIFISSLNYFAHTVFYFSFKL